MATVPTFSPASFITMNNYTGSSLTFMYNPLFDGPTENLSSTSLFLKTCINLLDKEVLTHNSFLELLRMHTSPDEETVKLAIEVVESYLKR